MKRREFLLAFGGAAVALPLAARAQDNAPRRLGVLMPSALDDQEVKKELAAFTRQMQSLGWTEGGNLRVDYRWSGGDSQKIQAHAKELVDARPDVIFVRSTPATAALLKNTRSIPIVFAVVSDPVGEGFAASVARPGGNVTGFTNAEASLSGKWLGLLKGSHPRWRASDICSIRKWRLAGEAFTRILSTPRPSHLRWYQPPCPFTAATTSSARLAILPARPTAA